MQPRLRTTVESLRNLLKMYIPWAPPRSYDSELWGWAPGIFRFNNIPGTWVSFPLKFESPGYGSPLGALLALTIYHILQSGFWGWNPRFPFRCRPRIPHPGKQWGTIIWKGDKFCILPSSTMGTWHLPGRSPTLVEGTQRSTHLCIPSPHAGHGTAQRGAHMSLLHHRLNERIVPSPQGSSLSRCFCGWHASALLLASPATI